MKILCIGDVTSPLALDFLCDRLWKIREELSADFVVVNVENAGMITGAGPQQAEKLLSSGADCLTGGNHTLRNRAIYSYIEDSSRMLRPINFGAEAPGAGYTILDCDGYKIMVISAMGNVHIEPNLDSPFEYIERALLREEGKYDIAVLDIHAEATGEKMAIAHAFDGKIGVIFGTHTHVPTADARILPRGTGYITDVGMCGESGGILGMETESVICRMRSHLPLPFHTASGECKIDCALFEVDTATGRTVSVKQLKL
jgi:metallophosphoesterase (TIGR00282 family)